MGQAALVSTETFGAVILLFSVYGTSDVFWGAVFIEKMVAIANIMVVEAT